MTTAGGFAVPRHNRSELGQQWLAQGDNKHVDGLPRTEIGRPRIIKKERSVALLGVLSRRVSDSRAGVSAGPTEPGSIAFAGLRVPAVDEQFGRLIQADRG